MLHLRLNETEIGTWVLRDRGRRRGRAGAPTPRCSRRTPTTGWCARSCSTGRDAESGSTSARAPDRAGRAGLAASPARCSRSCWPPTAPTCWTRAEDDRRRRRGSLLDRRRTSARYPMGNGLTRLAAPLLRRGRPIDAARADDRHGARCRRARRARPRHLHARRHRLGGRGPPRRRGARRLLARRADRHGGQPALRRAARRWRPRSSRGSRPGRTGSSSAPTPSGRRAR